MNKKTKRSFSKGPSKGDSRYEISKKNVRQKLTQEFLKIRKTYSQKECSTERHARRNQAIKWHAFTL